MKIIKTIESELDNYLNKDIDLSDGVKFSQAKLVKRISLFQNQIYKTGKKDSQGNYKYYYDIISPRVNSEIKNIDFDTKDVLIWSEMGLIDKLAVIISNLFLKKWLTDNNKGEEINDSIEGFSSWGNVVWKKVKGGYNDVDLKNFFVLNQTAKTLDDSDVIERHLMTQSDLRAKKGVWENVDEVIKTCGNKFFSATKTSQEIETTNNFYEIYERNGEICEKDLFEAQGEEGGSEDNFVLAKIITAGLKKGGGIDNKYILFAEKISEKPYKEAHRGRYEGRWFRKGLYEILFDCQTRANEIGNQIARGLEWASKTFFRSSDTLIIQNALTDMRSGDIVKAKELAQVETRMQGFDQLLSDWNRNIEVANVLANSYEVVTGESLPSNTPFRLGAMMNQNANKLFDFLREKLSLAFEGLFNDWILPEMMKDIKSKKVLELSGDDELLKQYREVVARAWYVKNLLIMPPHSIEQGKEFINFKVGEMEENKEERIGVEKGFWDSFKPRAKVVISGDNVNLSSELETLSTFIQLETDPVRRAFLLDLAYAKKNINIPPPVNTELNQTKPTRELKPKEDKLMSLSQ